MSQGTQREELNEYLKNLIENNPYICNLYNYWLSHEENIGDAKQEYQETKIYEDEEKYKCPFCEKDITDIYFHMNKYHKEEKKTFKKILNFNKKAQKRSMEINQLKEEAAEIGELKSNWERIQTYNKLKNYFFKYDEKE